MHLQHCLRRLFLPYLIIAVAITVTVSGKAVGEQWPGSKAAWHGYDQFRFTVDGHNAYVVVPHKAAVGNPWVWRARFPDYHAEMDIALLDKGFHIGYVDVAGMYGSPAAVALGDKFYTLATEHGLAQKPVLEGVSRGGLFVYNWAAKNLDHVACIYCDTPVMDIRSWPGGKGKGVGSAASWKECLGAYGLSEEQATAYKENPLDHVAAIVKAGIPILHIVSESDRVVPPAENTYLALERVPEPMRRNFRIMKLRQGTEESQGHHFQHPNPSGVVSFIVQQAIYEGGYVSTTDSRTLPQIEAIYESMPTLKYAPPSSRCKNLPRTMQRLRDGGELRVVMLGDSIVNDTSRSAWNLLLARACPTCRIMKFTSVRGSTGCWWYQDNNRVERYVLEQEPDLVIIGGISQHDDIKAIGAVIDQIRKGGDAEILLLSGAFGRVDPTNDQQWQEVQNPASDSYRQQLQRLATEKKSEYLDMRAAWADYIRQSDKPLDWFKRDVVHANERGEQVIGRILFRYLTPESR